VYYFYNEAFPILLLASTRRTRKAIYLQTTSDCLRNW
jgi:hypothetical protein